MTGATGALPSTGAPPAALAARLGITHAAGRYHPVGGGFLTGGAGAVLAVGSRAIKLWFDGNPARMYSFDAPWSTPAALAELAAEPRFAAVFDMPFGTIALEAFRPDREAGYWQTAFTAEDERAEEEQFRDLTVALRRRRDAGRTYVLQNWEGDWAVRAHQDMERDAPPAALDRMQRWFMARQRGVEAGRRATPDSPVQVWHAAEVNLIDRAMRGGRTIATTILPELSCDLYSYSCWDAALIEGGLPAALEFIAERSAASEAFGEDNIMLGEFGCAEGSDPDSAAARTTLWARQALDFGCPYLFFWQLFDNEGEGDGPDLGCPGYWLIRPDGRHTASRAALVALLGDGA